MTPISSFSSLPVLISILIAAVPAFFYLGFPAIIRLWGRILGLYLWKKTEGRKLQIVASMEADHKEFQEKNVADGQEAEATMNTGSAGSSASIPTNSTSSWQDITKENFFTQEQHKDWDGVVGFLHPFCNAGGGGERVLWAAIRATQKCWPKAKCVVYTGDHGANKHEILNRVQARFNIKLYRPTICFLYLNTRDLVLASTWPHFTLLGQSIGSMVMLYDAFSMVVPDILVDTMGYAFALGFCKFLFPSMPTSAYVHYPTISTDMLDSLNPDSNVGNQGVNAGKGVGTRGVIKRIYWQIFAFLYSWVGGSIDVVMTNSSWTQNHIQKLWGPYRKFRRNTGIVDAMNSISVVYPPVSVTEMEIAIEVSQESETQRTNSILYIAQFRPEKNHQLIIQSFAEFLKSNSPASQDAELVLVGSVRDDQDSKRVYQLRLLVNELHIKERVKFHLDASWNEILQHLARCSVGVNGMWNEHFGIGVVEYQAAGLIVVAHDSGGPKMDIVVDLEDGPTGYHATTTKEFAEAYNKALSIPNPLAVRLRARASSRRFTEEVFAERWKEQMAILVRMCRSSTP